MLSRTIKHVDPRIIVVDLASRQRQQELDLADIIPSIRKHGVLFPILVEEDTDRIIAGWRRLATSIFLELPSIPVRYCKDLTDLERKELEFEENARRKDLTWQDNALAIHGLHSLKTELDPDWTEEQTAAFYNYGVEHIYKMLRLAEAILSGDQSIIKADTFANAKTLLIRRTQRAAGDALNSLLDVKSTAVGNSNYAPPSRTSGEPGELQLPGGDPGLVEPERQVAPPYTIIHADAHEFLQSYDGPKFNLLHCDLPYGVALNAQAGQASFEGGGYESSPDIYWALCGSIVRNWDHFMYPSAHVMFWISMKFYEETKEFFFKAAAQKDCPVPSDLRINPTPLVWHKTDNKGIISDALRGPRNVYEAALLMSTGDRHIVKPVSNVYGCPTAKGEDAIHTNEKPEPMLRYFLSMLVDERSRVFDPTTGSGSSIRTAESLGAEAALGLEFNPEFADRAQKKLLSARGLRQLSAVVDQATIEQATSTLDLTSSESDNG